MLLLLPSKNTSINQEKRRSWQEIFIIRLFNISLWHLNVSYCSCKRIINRKYQENPSHVPQDIHFYFVFIILTWSWHKLFYIFIITRYDFSYFPFIYTSCRVLIKHSNWKLFSVMKIWISTCCKYVQRESNTFTSNRHFPCLGSYFILLNAIISQR